MQECSDALFHEIQVLAKRAVKSFVASEEIASNADLIIVGQKVGGGTTKYGNPWAEIKVIKVLKGSTTGRRIKATSKNTIKSEIDEIQIGLISLAPCGRGLG